MALVEVPPGTVGAAILRDSRRMDGLLALLERVEGRSGPFWSPALCRMVGAASRLAGRRDNSMGGNRR